MVLLTVEPGQVRDLETTKQTTLEANHQLTLASNSSRNEGRCWLALVLLWCCYGVAMVLLWCC
jgi:hypothetical protein